MTPDTLLSQLRDIHPLAWAAAYWLLELERHPSKVRADAAAQAIKQLASETQAASAA